MQFRQKAVKTFQLYLYGALLEIPLTFEKKLHILKELRFLTEPTHLKKPTDLRAPLPAFDKWHVHQWDSNLRIELNHHREFAFVLFLEN